MEENSPPTLAESIAAAQAWWHDAGVDLAFHDEPQTWLAPLPGDQATPSPASSAVKTEQSPTRIGGDRSQWPRDVASFARWWLDEASLDPAMRGRIAPHGPANPALMIVVPMPEVEDRETLLTGPQGRLLANMVRAMGAARDEVYLASALARHTPMADWDHWLAAGMGEVLMHHIELVAPERLIVLGRDVLPLLGHDPAQPAPAVSELSIQTRKLSWLSSYAPGRLLEHPRYRAQLWRRWLDWTGTGT